MLYLLRLAKTTSLEPCQVLFHRLMDSPIGTKYITSINCMETRILPTWLRPKTVKRIFDNKKERAQSTNKIILVGLDNGNISPGWTKLFQEICAVSELKWVFELIWSRLKIDSLHWPMAFFYVMGKNEFAISVPFPKYIKPRVSVSHMKFVSDVGKTLSLSMLETWVRGRSGLNEGQYWDFVVGRLQ